LRDGNTRERVEKSVGDVLGGRIRVITTPYSGLSLDVDEVEDYEVLNRRYSDWIAIHDATDAESLGHRARDQQAAG
jgi:hypothetical protein